MAGNPHPVYRDGVNVAKSAARSYTLLRLATANELRALDGSTFWYAYIQELGADFVRSTTDTTSPDDNETVIIDANGARWIRLSLELVLSQTPIAGGSDKSVFYNNNGKLGEYAVSGAGDVAMTSDPDISITATGTTTARSLADRFANIVYPEDFGGKTADAINLAIAYANSIGGATVELPKGTINLDKSIVMRSYVRLRGQGVRMTRLRMNNGVNQDVIFGLDAYLLAGSTDPDIGIHDWEISSLSIDGNRDNNTVGGSGIFIVGYRYKIDDVDILNTRDDGLSSYFTDVSGTNGLSMEANITNIRTENTGKHGYRMNGPHDSNLHNIIAINASQNADAAYHGYYGGPNMNGRVVGFHGWCGASVVNRPFAQFYDSGAHDVSNSHFEGSRGPVLVLAGPYSRYDETNLYYAPYGNSIIYLSDTAQVNTVKGTAYTVALNRNARGVVLGGSGGGNCSLNEIDLYVGNCELGAVDFTYSKGNNKVTVRGYQTSGPKTVGTPQASDRVDIRLPGGATGSDIRKDPSLNSVGLLHTDANGYVTTSSVVAADIASDAVTQSKIQDGAVTTSKLAAAAVTFAKIQSISAARLLGSVAGGSIAELTEAQIKTILGMLTTTTDNSVPRFDGTTGNFQASGVTINDSNNMVVPGVLVPGANGHFSLYDDATSAIFQVNNAKDFLLYMSGGPAEVFKIGGATGYPFFKKHGTTASAANAYIDSSTGQLQRSTSSARVKTAIRDLLPIDVDVIRKLRAVSFVSKLDKQKYVGLIAEEVAPADSRLVDFDEAGLPENVRYAHIVAPLIAFVQMLECRLSTLEVALHG